MTVALLDAHGHGGPAPSTLVLPPVARPDSIFLYERAVPAEWSRALAETCPQYEGISSFHIAWEPGEEWEPIQRYMIWQDQTREMTQKLILRDYPGCTGLTQEHPRLNAKWDAVAKCYVKQDGTLAKTDKLTYERYHRTGRYGVRFWVIQGDTGGHRFNLSHLEKQILKFGSNGKMRDVPLPGDLPYAPFDGRVLPHFARIEQAAMARKVCKYALAHVHQLDLDERNEWEYARTLLFDYLGAQFGELYDEFKPFIKEQLRKIPVPVGAKKVQTDGDELKDRFVTDR